MLEIIISLVGIAITIILSYIFAIKPRAITCFTLPTVSLTEIKEEVKEKTKLYYEDKIVENISSVLIKVKNTGLRAIRKEHFVKPLQFIFDEKSNIVNWSVKYRKPRDIEIDIDCQKNIATCRFDLLNRGNEFVVKFILINGKGELKNVEGKVEEVKKIKIAKGITETERLTNIFRGVAFTFIGIFFTSVLLIALLQGIPIKSREDWMIVIMFIFLGPVSILAGFKNFYDCRKVVSEKGVITV